MCENLCRAQGSYLPLNGLHLTLMKGSVSINPKPARPSILTVLRDITSTLVKMKGAREAYEVSGAEEGGATTRYQFR
ncbi:hypothetical protein F444_11886 [Phytophthora nicotianae P1976]|uniref:Uncharacterized protein n=1 Tax=Phytophthora nicotianae P1976 TaxID=1317066 RepID=A0A080ZYY2_PHYNI|nr:hypothetical protein F444_11886 [Phytophthora nicotianae P1976]